MSVHVSLSVPPHLTVMFGPSALQNVLKEAANEYKSCDDTDPSKIDDLCNTLSLIIEFMALSSQFKLFIRLVRYYKCLMPLMKMIADAFPFDHHAIRRRMSTVYNCYLTFQPHTNVSFSTCDDRRARRDDNTTSCNNITCGAENNSRKTRLLQCGACHVVKYCSKSCQKTHWKYIHKYMCCMLKSSHF